MKEKTMEWFERRFPKFFTISVLVICSFCKINISKIAHLDSMLSNTITIVSIFIGILMSMMGFLLTVSGRNVVKNIRNTGVHTMIMNYFIIPIFIGIIIVILSVGIGAFICNEEVVSNSMYIISAFWLTSISYFVSSVIRIIVLMYIILTRVFEEIGYDVETNNDEFGKNEKLKRYDSEDEGNIFDNPDDYL
mgnify:CR=1 FL=1